MPSGAAFLGSGPRRAAPPGLRATPGAMPSSFRLFVSGRRTAKSKVHCSRSYEYEGHHHGAADSLRPAPPPPPPPPSRAPEVDDAASASCAAADADREASAVEAAADVARRRPAMFFSPGPVIAARPLS